LSCVFFFPQNRLNHTAGDVWLFLLIQTFSLTFMVFLAFLFFVIPHSVFSFLYFSTILLHGPHGFAVNHTAFFPLPSLFFPPLFFFFFFFPPLSHPGSTTIPPCFCRYPRFCVRFWVGITGISRLLLNLSPLLIFFSLASLRHLVFVPFFSNSFSPYLRASSSVFLFTVIVVRSGPPPPLSSMFFFFSAAFAPKLHKCNVFSSSLGGSSPFPS